jgi:hypothetical protein
MPWNYRIMKRKYPTGETTYGVYEVHYYEANNIKGYTETSVSPECETIEEAKEILEMMLSSFDKPTLDYGD